ncbi:MULTISPECIES: GIY-YIG nuclease family protein [unclassified Rhodococcus (in: high G+C Gram-positive bacteria)]|uniref:GIY-YIG nuclease family protein n=1 Tax=unclassified Rhodococcus (in: high G+C Gram-positive bacteria) TaxID=192944 RepID=UPI00163B3C1A|nr:MULTISPECIES: GIY-YIG nuclease family protein [unclassified Rhodococcus (in: high G+C Gram-positive bacteria)]MBC2639087.1 GIY-YIG nuclease family protein [Rhodococcus sp. 3A]MBC2896171.1 GIY-YIG nuclease family protein [Rhodococcus sp. 4CII]
MDSNNTGESPFLLFDLPDEIIELAFVPVFLGWSLDASLGLRNEQLELRIHADAPSPGLDGVQVTAVFVDGEWFIDLNTTGSLTSGGHVVAKDSESLIEQVFSCVPAYLAPSAQTDLTDPFLDLRSRIDDEELVEAICDSLQTIGELYGCALAAGGRVSVTHTAKYGRQRIELSAALSNEMDKRLLVPPAHGEEPIVPGPVTASWSLDNGDWVLDSEATGFVGATGRVDGDLDEIMWAIAVGAPDCVFDASVIASTRHSGGAMIPPSGLPATPMNTEEQPAAEVVSARLRQIGDWATENGFSGRLSPTRAEVTRYLQDSGHGTVGYYVLEFRDGQCYVGESIDLPARLDQHRGRYSDLQGIRLRPDDAPRRHPNVKRHLRLQERAFIHGAQEAGLYARNINEMATMIGASKHLDEVVSSAEQKKWLRAPDGRNASDPAGRRAYSDERLASSTVNFRQFVTRPDADQIARILGHYLSRCVPYPARTEYQSWALSCLTQPDRKRGRLSCITIAMTETLTLMFEGGRSGLRGKIQVNDAELFPTEFSEIAFLRRHPSIRIGEADYQESGPGQSFLYAYSLDDIERLLDDVAVTRAAATTALHIMRKGPCMQRKVHSPQLTEAAFRYVPSTAVNSALTY